MHACRVKLLLMRYERYKHFCQMVAKIAIYEYY